MKIFADKQLIKSFAQIPHTIAKQSTILKLPSPITLEWPSLFAYIGLEALPKNIPTFDENEEIFQTCLTVLHEDKIDGMLFNLYDRLFAEYLTYIKSLPEINAAFLANKIQEEQQKASFLVVSKWLAPSLSNYERALIHNPSQIMHDLILYLAWDRMCVALGRLFDYQTTDAIFIRGLETLRKCLVESFQHITAQGKTSPSFYRLVEALFFYEMREENLDKHADNEWALLSQSFSVLLPQYELVDCYYIDNCLSLKNEAGDAMIQDRYLTFESKEKMDKRLELMLLMVQKLNAETDLEWKYSLRSSEIVYLDLNS